MARHRRVSLDGYRQTEAYKINVLDAALKVCTVKSAPCVLLGHAEAIVKSPAIYPFTKSKVKRFAIAKGQYSFSDDNLFQSEVPCQMIVGLVSSAAANGDYNNNPYNFGNFACNYLGFFVDGQSVPSHPLQPNWHSKEFVESYQTLIGKTRAGRDIGRVDYSRGGYTFYVINPYGEYDDEKRQLVKRGHTRLELKFSRALTESCTVIVYGKFPGLMTIDQSRNVSVQ